MNNSVTQRCWSYSIGLHMLLLILLLLLHLEISIEDEYLEMSFAFTEARTPTPTTVRQPAPLQRRAAPPVRTRPPAESVTLPERQMRELEEPEIHVPRRGAALAAAELAPLGDRLAAPAPDSREILDIRGHTGFDQRELAGSRPEVAGDRLSAPIGETLSGGGAREAFNIEWIGTAREKLSGVLPTYPPGVQENMTIRLAFDVDPAGGVANAIPVQKGQAQLENAAIRAIKTWQFNPLESSAPQQVQRGVIAFHFRIR